MSESTEPTDFGEYWAILWRRKNWFIGPFVGVLVVAAALAFLLPPVYRSEATVLIERQSIPSDVVETTVTGYVQEQIEQLRQRVNTRKNLLRIAKQFDLYPGRRDSDPDGVFRDVAKNIEVQMVDVQASSPDQNGQRVATIAFTVAYSAGTPEAAQAVANDLVEWYLREHKADREERAADVTDFLGVEAEKLRAEISAREKELAKFKQEEMRQLPEMMDMNLRLYEKTEQDISTSEEAIRTLQERLNADQAELSLTPPYKDVLDDSGKRMLTGDERLSSLTAEYLRASARYSPEHPDIIRLSREIRSLAGQSGMGARTDELMQELTKQQEALRQARQKYSEDHPEVIKLEKSVAAVERGFQAAMLKSGGKPNALVAPPDNARYVALKTQIDASEGDLKAERQKLEMLNGKLSEYEARLFQTPVVERDFKSLSRDYESAQARYADLMKKQMEAKVAQELESGKTAQRFVLSSPPNLPTTPDSPNRIGIMLLGGLFAFVAGLGSVTVVEYQDKTIRSVRSITNIMGAPPLAIIPQMSVAALAKRLSK
jgi:succinoglycan biosynthesis transport protein ExoP